MITATMENQATPFGPFALEKNRQLATKNTLLFELVVSNMGATDFFVQLWDVTSAGAISGASDYELSVTAGSFVPFAWPGGYQFHDGLYVRCVTALGGSTAIPASDAKFSGRYITPFPIAT